MFTALLSHQFVTDDARYLLVGFKDAGTIMANNSKGLYNNNDN